MTQFHLEPNAFSIPSLRDVAKEWSSIPDPRIRGMIAVEYQYLVFHRYLLASLHFTWYAGYGLTIEGKLDHSIRAGAIKAPVLVSASIVEAALRAHAEKRCLDLPKNERHRTFGAVIDAWEKSCIDELQEAWNDIKLLKDHRNTVHLYKAAEERKDFREALAAEERLLGAAEHAIAAVKRLRSF